MKERFAVGRKPRPQAAPGRTSSASHDLPDPMKREVYARDQGRCAFVDENGNRCPETGGLEFDHIDGLAHTHVHDVDRSRLLCRVHNQLAAEQLYGRGFMDDSARSAKKRGPPPAVLRRSRPKRRAGLAPGQASSNVSCRPMPYDSSGPGARQFWLRGHSSGRSEPTTPSARGAVAMDATLVDCAGTRVAPSA